VSRQKVNGKGYEKVVKTIDLPPGLTEKQKEKEVSKAAVIFEEEVINNKVLDGSKITLKDFVETIWWPDYAEKELAPQTLVNYRIRLDARVIPALGHFKLARIQPHHITAFYNNLAEPGVRMDVLYMASPEFPSLIEGKSHKWLSEQIGLDRHVFSRLRDGKCVFYESAQKICAYFNVKNMDEYFIEKDPEKTLSNKSIHHHHTLLSAIFSYAVEYNLLMDNPCQRVRLPSVTKTKSAPAKYYDEDQVMDLFVALEDEPIKYRTIIYLAIDTGLRLSEVAGLEWHRIDLENQAVKIEQQRQYVHKKGVIIDDPKTDEGIRVVTLSDMVTLRLRDYKFHQDNMRSLCGTAWHESEFVFTHDDGVPIFPRRPSVWFSEFVKKKGLPKLTFHQLRHTNASLQIAGGVDVVTLAGRLGHSDKTITLNTYSHIIRSREKMAANKMDQFYNAHGFGENEVRSVVKRRKNVN
jgi:integrase